MQNQIPPRTLEAIRAYVEERVPPGGFLYSVLCNNLLRAVITADEENRKALAEIVRELYGNAPSGCWGSPENVRAWLNPKEDETPLAT